MTFRVGQRIVCVNDEFHCDTDGDLPKRGCIYTVRWIGCRPTDSGPGVMLHGLHGGYHSSGVEYCFCATRFRPVVERKTDISFAHEILRKASKRVRA